MDVEHVKAHTEEQTFVMKGNAKADALANEGADADGGHVAVAKA